MINLALINQTIQELCVEAGETTTNRSNWRALSEEELMQEAAVCIFGSQMIYEVSISAADRLSEHGMFRWQEYRENWQEEYESKVVRLFSTPLLVKVNGKTRKVMPRLKNRLARLLTKTMASLRESGTSIRQILASSISPRDARKKLIDYIWGFGPKQASLFLRRVAFCSELAVLDTHVLHYLRLARGIAPQPSALSRLSVYERMETEFQRIAEEFGQAVGTLDLAMWITMRVAKREALI